jgi:nucleoside-diphosphate-sugar epimerase
MARVTTGVDTVFHLASSSESAIRGGGSDDAHRAVTLEGTRNLLNGASAAGSVERLVFFSSVKAMGESSVGLSDEKDEPRPTTAYGRWKLAAEALALEHGRRSGTHVCCLRLPMVWGPGNHGNLPRLAAAIDRGLLPPLPDTGNKRSLVHIEDVVNAALLAATSPNASHHVYIVTDGLAYSGRQIYERLCAALGKSVPRWQVPDAVMRALAAIGDVARVAGLPAPFNSDVYGKLLGSAWYSSAAISRDLGFQPAVPLEAGLPAFVAWYRDRPR